MAVRPISAWGVYKGGFPHAQRVAVGFTYLEYVDAQAVSGLFIARHGTSNGIPRSRYNGAGTGDLEANLGSLKPGACGRVWMFTMGAIAGLIIGGIAGLLAGVFLAGELVSRDIVKD